MLFAGAAFLLLVTEPWLERMNRGLFPTTGRGRTLVGLALATAVAIAISLPVWTGIVHGSAAAHDGAVRNGGIFGHAPELRYSPAIIVCLLLAMLWPRAWKNRWFAMAFLLASLFVLNIQVIHGSTIQPGHWTGYYIQPLFLLVAMDWLWTAANVERRQALVRWAPAAVLLIAGIGTNAYKLTAGAREAADFNRRDAAFEQVLETMREPALRTDGFLSNDVYLSAVLPAFVTEKPLRPSFMDPLSNGELATLKNAALSALNCDAGSAGLAPQNPGAVLRPEKFMLVLNLHRSFGSCLLDHRHTLLRNADFLVLGPSEQP